VGAIKDIDSISANTPQPSPDQAFQLIQPILTNLHYALFPPLVAAPTGLPAAPTSLAREAETLQLQIESISSGIWLIYGVALKSAKVENCDEPDLLAAKMQILLWINRHSFQCAFAELTGTRLRMHRASLDRSDS
jgi:hypothetical protein